LNKNNYKSENVATWSGIVCWEIRFGLDDENIKTLRL